MTTEMHLALVVQLQKLFPDYSVGIDIKANSMYCMGSQIKTLAYRVFVFKNGEDHLICEAFNNEKDLLDYLESFGAVPNMKSPLQIIAEAKEQAKKFEQKNRIGKHL